MTLRVDTKAHKSAIHQFILQQCSHMHGTVLDVGCGDMPYKDLVTAPGSRVEKYLGLDLEQNHIDRSASPDLTWDGVTIPLPDQSVDVAIATEVLEHCPDTAIILGEINRVLKPGGSLVFTVPFLWPLHEVPHDYFRFTPFGLQVALEKAGFRHAEVNMLGGWDASLAQMMGLWVVRRPGFNRFFRLFLKLLFLPVMALLLRTDSKSSGFNEGQMVSTTHHLCAQYWPEVRNFHPAPRHRPGARPDFGAEYQADQAVCMVRRLPAVGYAHFW